MATEPVTGTIAGGAAVAASVAAVSAMLASLGIQGSVMAFSTMGAITGLIFAPQLSTPRAVSTFIAASLISAKLGVIVALARYGASEQYAGGLAAVIGALFHPILSSAALRIPAWISSKGPAK